MDLLDTGLEGHEVYLADECPAELRSELRTLGVTTRRLDLASISQGGSLELRTTNLVLLPSHDSDGCPIDETAEVIRSRFPHVSLFVYAPSLRAIQGRLPSLAWAGVDQAYVLATQSDRITLMAAIRRRLLAPPPAAALRALAKGAPSSEGRTLAMWLLRNGCFSLGVKDVRAMFGKDLKTLQKSLAPFDKLGVLLRFGIVLHAHELRRIGVVRRKAVAMRLGLASPDSLWRKEHLIHVHAFDGVLQDVMSQPR